MGMGEPLHNYDETMSAIRILADEQGLAVPPRRITVSTVGLLPALDRLAHEPVMPNLAISLHAPTDALRSQLVPLNAKYGVADIIAACRRFPLKTPQPNHLRVRAAGRRQRLARRRAGAGAVLVAAVKSKVNLIPLNAAAGIPFERPSDSAIDTLCPDAERARGDRLGSEEPRARHPGRVRAIAGGGTARSLQRSAWR